MPMAGKYTREHESSSAGSNLSFKKKKKFLVVKKLSAYKGSVNSQSAYHSDASAVTQIFHAPAAE